MELVPSRRIYLLYSLNLHIIGASELEIWLYMFFPLIYWRSRVWSQERWCVNSSKSCGHYAGLTYHANGSSDRTLGLSPINTDLPSAILSLSRRP